ncbi:MAG TPA: BON domain-containing protein [Gammaproteobacteria bacterium]|jgi:hyperosmotically inducible protein|nr:BON domain-containing protein [Gammaproteobacteria bacterium]HET7587622.1 BON domain-containing protein [Gammaproteobacteria bacterium]
MRISPLLMTAAVLAAGLGLAACGQDNGSGTDGQTAGEQTQATVNNAQSEAGQMADQAQTAASDTAITAAVKSKLLANSSTSGMDIHVETNSGVVTLSGTVTTDAEKNLAERIARNTNGVTDVTNNLKVKSG